jgi:glutathione S-transferase
MLQLYFYPHACSLASRIALLEAGVEARYHLTDIFTKKVVDSGAAFLDVAPKGAVPVLVLDSGETLTESAAVLQYIADLKPELGLAPPQNHPDRYRLQEWLSFVGTEIHKAFLFPTFWYDNDAAKAAARQRISQNVTIVADHLKTRRYVIGDRFTVMDGYLAWALSLLKFGGVELGQWPTLAAYLARMQERPAIKTAFALERELLKTLPPRKLARAIANS